MSTVINLLAIGRPSVEILIEYLEDDDWVVREAAADLLGKIGDVRAVEPLMQRLRVDKDTGVKELAMKSLGLIGDARPAQLYIEAIPIRPLRVYAMEALAKVKDVECVAAVQGTVRSVENGPGRPRRVQFRVDRRQTGSARWDACRESGGQDNDE